MGKQVSDELAREGTMLILARKVGEAIAIADDIKIKVVDIQGGQVRLGVEAPAHISVHREEIYQRILEENRRAALEAPAELPDFGDVFQQGKKKTKKT